MEAVEPEELEQALFVGFASGKADADGVGSAAGIVVREVDHGLDAGKGLQQAVQVRGDAGPAHLTQQQRGQQQGNDAIGSMNPHFLVGPVQ